MKPLDQLIDEQNERARLRRRPGHLFVVPPLRVKKAAAKRRGPPSQTYAARHMRAMRARWVEMGIYKPRGAA